MQDAILVHDAGCRMHGYQFGAIRRCSMRCLRFRTLSLLDIVQSLLQLTQSSHYSPVTIAADTSSFLRVSSDIGVMPLPLLLGSIATILTRSLTLTLTLISLLLGSTVAIV